MAAYIEAYLWTDGVWWCVSGTHNLLETGLLQPLLLLLLALLYRLGKGECDRIYKSQFTSLDFHSMHPHEHLRTCSDVHRQPPRQHETAATHTLTPQASSNASLSPLILHDYFHVSLFETKESIEKAIGDVVVPFFK